MKVRAKDIGYFDLKRRKVGEEFIVEDVAELGRWMEPVSEKDQAAYDKEMARRDAERARNRRASTREAANLQSDNVL